MINSKKIVLVGHFGVGKTSLIRRFVNNIFTEDYKVTIGVHIFKKEIEVNNTKLTFVIWDLEGKDDVEKVRKSHLIGTSGFIYVFDPTRNTTYNNIDVEVDYLKSNYPKAQLLTIANKVDLIDQKAFRQEVNFPIDFFTSAKTSENVEAIFNQLGLNFLTNG
ncbi:Rab family GTPase [uncultured Flavobacterium sp.]|uniref:Rab family GTPase n=1 Tax=uncultured Flavobacterium sp. TaxID=165435 RepID=UPI0030C8BC5A